MKLEFFVNTELGDGRQIHIEASEFVKAEITKTNSTVLLLQQKHFFRFMELIILSIIMNIKKY